MIEGDPAAGRDYFIHEIMQIMRIRDKVDVIRIHNKHRSEGIMEKEFIIRIIERFEIFAGDGPFVIPSPGSDSFEQMIG